jgi:ubiquitin-protein ligase
MIQSKKRSVSQWMALKRLMKDSEEIRRDSPQNCSAEPIGNEFF